MAKTNRKGWIVLIIGAALAALVWKAFLAPPFEYAGTIEATRIELPARVATVVHSVEVVEGQSVEAGQVVARLSCEDLILSQKLIEISYQRALKLKQSGSISGEVFDQAQNRKQEMDLRVGWCDIKSPVKGTILTRILEPSEWVNPGTKILVVANLSELWAYFYVPQGVMSKLKVGTEVLGSVPEMGRTFSGKIVKINDEAEFTPKNVQTQSERTRLVFGVKVMFSNSDGMLKPGMTIQSVLVGR